MSVMYFARTVVFPELGTALRCDVTGIFVPRLDDYTLTDVRGARLRPIGVGYAAGDLVTMDQDNDTLVHRIPIWTNRVYRTSYVTTEYPSVALNVERTHGTVVATVTNQSDLILEGCKVARGNLVWTVPHAVLEPGETISVTLDPAVANRSDAGTDNILRGTPGIPRDTTADGREFDLRDALDRGATVLMCTAAARVKGPLVVNGERRTELSGQTIQVVTYEEDTL